MSASRILLAVYPYGATGRKPLDLLEQTGWELVYNPHGRRLIAGEVGELIRDIDAVIAGIEPYDAEVLRSANRLKAICRIGIGVDAVDLGYCRKHGIHVTNTPDGPTRGVAEMTLCFMVHLLRNFGEADRSVRDGRWKRLMGRCIDEVKIGIIGVGRIGKRLINLLEPHEPKILAYDIDPNVHGTSLPNVEWCDLDRLLCESDLVTLHFPMNEHNRRFIGQREIGLMKKGCQLINTARGEVIDESALEEALLQGHIAAAALDVFEKEPYEGGLAEMDNVILTPHIGATTVKSRYEMELVATEDCIRILRGDKPLYDVMDEIQNGITV
jgi:D-3-phosphoglycerate dehydrogenase